MAKNKSNRLEMTFAILVLILSLVVFGGGAIFCYMGVTQIVSISDIDVNILLRNPSEYMLSKRDIAMGGLEILVPGVIMMLLGAIVMTISITRCITMDREGRAILNLDRRVEKLEKSQKK